MLATKSSLPQMGLPVASLADPEFEELAQASAPAPGPAPGPAPAPAPAPAPGPAKPTKAPQVEARIFAAPIRLNCLDYFTEVAPEISNGYGAELIRRQYKSWQIGLANMTRKHEIGEHVLEDVVESVEPRKADVRTMLSNQLARFAGLKSVLV